MDSHAVQSSVSYTPRRIYFSSIYLIGLRQTGVIQGRTIRFQFRFSDFSIVTEHPQGHLPGRYAQLAVSYSQNLKPSDTLEGRDPLSNPISRDRVANNHHLYS